ncbi:glycosyltransferase family 4 protein [Winogradskyella sp. A3E31]|uniref:glycosyltransferase family 4 protein n=1 Tax=Winogradskyella sp. A3E31 TaxID=3349637 RepID=UPI00398B9928
MTTSKHIVILSSEFPPLPGGIGNQAYHLAKYLALEYAEVTVITDQRGDLEDEALFDNKLSFTVKRIPKTSARFVMYFERLRRLIAVLRSADVLIATGKFSLWLGALVSSFYNLKTIAIIHGTEVNFKSLLLRQSIDWALVRFDAVVAVSQFTKGLVSHLPLKEIVVIPNGYDPDHWSSHMTKQNRIDTGPQLITVGRVSERKGQRNVIKHLPSLMEAYPTIHYHCVGLPQDTEACQQLAKALDIESHITFHGMLSHETLEQLYQHMDIAVMLSQTTATGDVEGFGIALLEANHYGIPTVGSKGCGIEDAISEGVSGELIEPHNAVAFKEAIHKILANKQRYTQGAKAWASQHQWQHSIKAYTRTIEA